jgi:hypothetical protein
MEVATTSQQQATTVCFFEKSNKPMEVRQKQPRQVPGGPFIHSFINHSLSDDPFLILGRRDHGGGFAADAYICQSGSSVPKTATGIHSKLTNNGIGSITLDNTAD